MTHSHRARRTFPLRERPGAPEVVALSRRSFIRIATGISGGLLLGVNVLAEAAEAQQAAPRPAAPPFAPGAYVRIAPDGRITLYSKCPEIGQGVKTGLALILAEELDAKWSDVTVEQAPVNSAVYGSQTAGGSRSIGANWMVLRQAGAGARAMLVAAAAKQWGVPEAEITTSESMLRHASSNRSASYGSLATAAADSPLPDPDSLKLKDRKAFRLLGRRHGGVDNLQILTGTATFGIDVKIPDMRIAVFQKCPAIYGRVQSANIEEIRRMPDVLDAFIVEGTGKPSEILPGVAILAKHTWAAIAAKRQLKVVWDLTTASKDSWTGFTAEADKIRTQLVGAQVVKSTGDIEQALASGRQLEGTYTYGFVSHAQLEPQNCTAWFRKDAQGDSLEVWAPSQTPGNAQTLVASVLGIPASKVTIHQMRAGGGFGRRLNNDYVVEAAQISRQAGGVPVKLMWTREDDMEHDFYRPGGFMSFRAALDAKGSIAGWNSHLVHFRSEGGTAVTAANWQPNEFPALHVPAYRASQTLLPLRMPTGSWRAPGSNTAAWVVQSFLHELSVAAKRDHVEFLLETVSSRAANGEGLPPAQPAPPGLVAERARSVIRAVAERSGWGSRKLAAGRALGIAFHYSHQGHFAEVAEVSVAANRKVTVHKVWVVGDIGPIVNLSSAEAQVQGSVIDAISTLALEVTMENGQIEQKNFDQYRMARIQVATEVDVHFLDTDYPPSGVGEPAFPPAAPAICNAIHAAAGHRIRTLPITREGFSI